MSTIQNAVAVETTIIPFSASRKAMIKHLKAFLTAKENMPYRNAKNIRIPQLFHKDYAVYAALRGADYKKTSHQEDGANAKEAIEMVIHSLNTFSVKQQDLLETRKTSFQPWHFANRYLHDGATIADVQELKLILVEAIA